MIKRPPCNALSLLTLLAVLVSGSVFASKHDTPSSYTMTKTKLNSLTLHQALQHLVDGNQRFLNGKSIHRNLLNQKKFTSKHGQYPVALILSCMDSRGVPEIIFDQGVGDIFTVRLAGNVIDADQLGGMEYATKVVGTKLIVVMGHTQCGAVKGACSSIKMGHLTQLLGKIKPAIDDVKNKQDGKISCGDSTIIDKMAKQNVLNGIKQVISQSSIIRDLRNNHKMMIVGAMHYLDTGKVYFFDENGREIQ